MFRMSPETTAPGSIAPESLASGGTGPRVAVVIVSTGRPRLLDRLLLSLAGQTLPPDEVVVVGRGDGPRVRLLLLARTAGEWWDRFRGASAETEGLLADCPVHELEPLAPDGERRDAEFALARAEFAAALSVPSPAGPAPSLPGGATVLTVHVAALASVLQSGAAALPELEGERLETVLLRHERRYWERAAAEAGLTLRSATLARLVAVAALCGADDFADAERVIGALRETTDLRTEERDAVAGWLRGLYPADSSYWGALQPDRLGEHLVAVEAARPAPFVEPVVDGLLAGGGVPQVVHALRVLARAAVNDGGTAGRLTDLVAARPVELAGAAARLATEVERPGPLVAALRRVIGDPSVPDADLAGLGEDLHPFSQVLSGVRLDWTTRMVDARRADPEGDPRDLAQLMMGMPGHRARTGDLGAAFADITDLRRLVNGLEASTARDWAFVISRIDEADLLVRAFHPARAKLVFEATWPLLWECFDEDDVDDWTIVAYALRGHAFALWLLGESEDAAFLATEAATLLRDLVADGPPDEKSLPTLLLVEALAVLGGARQRLGDVEGALAAHDEALRIIEAPAAERPDIFGIGLAVPLFNGAAALEALGRIPEALAWFARAITMLRGLSELAPGPHHRPLTAALIQRTRLLALRGRADEAETTADEALRTARGDPFVSNGGYYAMVFAGGADALRVAGIGRLAVTFAKEAVRYRLDRDGNVPAERLLDLFRTVRSLLLALRSVGETREVGRVLNGCLRQYRASGGSATLVDELAQLQETAGPGVDRWAVVRDLCAEVVDRHRGVPGEEGDLAVALRAHWIALDALGEHEAALEAVKEAIGAHPPAPSGSDDFRGLLYTYRSYTLAKLGRPSEEGLTDAAAAVALFRRRETPALHVVLPLLTMARRYAALGRWEEARGAAGEVVAMTRDVGTWYMTFAGALVECVRSSAMLGRHREAERWTRELLDFERAHPSELSLDGRVYVRLARAEMLDDLGEEPEEAERLAHTALDLASRLPEDDRDRRVLQAHVRLAAACRRLGRFEEALDHEAAVISLRRTSPALRQGLERSLIGYANGANRLGRYDEAEEAAREAAELLRGDGPESLRVLALDALHVALLMLGRSREAADVLAEAVMAARAGGDGDGARRNLAGCLVALAGLRLRLGDRAAAAETAEEAVRLLSAGDAADGMILTARALAVGAAARAECPAPGAAEAALALTVPHPGTADLALGLLVFVQHYLAFRPPDLVLAVSARTIALLRPGAVSDRRQADLLADALCLHAWMSLVLGSADECAALIAEGRRVAGSPAPPAAPSLVQAVSVLSETACLTWLGDPERAIGPVLGIAEAIAEISMDIPGRAEWIMRAWQIAALCHCLLGDGEAGAAAASRALDRLPDLWIEDDPAEGSRAFVLVAKARSEFLLERDDDALATLEDAVPLCRTCQVANGHIGTAALAFALTTQAEVLARQGRTEPARKAAEEALPLWDEIRAAGLRTMEGLPERARVVLHPDPGGVTPVLDP